MENIQDFDPKVNTGARTGFESLIVVVTYNSSDFITRCLHSIFSSDYKDWFLTIIDNNSSDRTLDAVRGFIKNAPNENHVELLPGQGAGKLIKKVNGFYRTGNFCLVGLRKNIGFASAVNFAVFNNHLYDSDHDFSKTRYLVLINPDVILEKNTIPVLVKTFESDNKKPGAVSGLIYDYEGEKIQNAGGKILCNFLSYHLTDNPYGAEHIYETDYASGSVFATRMDLFKAIGGFDTGYRPLYFEELDYCLKLKRSGFNPVVNTGSVARHFEAASIKKFSGDFYRHYHKNRVRCAVINSGIIYFFKKFLICELEWLVKKDKGKSEKMAINEAYFLNFLFFLYNLFIKLKNFLKIKKLKKYI
jgi:GT2 family glycosyltransferase